MRLKIGIQGGPASFNESALNDYVKRHGITDYSTEFLFTTEKVLKALNENTIDYGLFAIHNSKGGIVKESLYAIAKYTFEIVEEFAIKISHSLMKRKDVNIDEIKTVMAHDQVFKQCKMTLEKRYSYLQQIVGKDDYIDTATAAKAVAESILPKNTFILGNEAIAKLYNFDVIDTNLQDDQENYTSFIVVRRINSVL